MQTAKIDHVTLATLLAISPDTNMPHESSCVNDSREQSSKLRSILSPPVRHGTPESKG